MPFTKKTAGAAGKKSSRALPKDIKDSREMTRAEFKITLETFLKLSKADLKAILKDDSLSVLTHIVANISLKSMESGDHTRFNFMIENIMGKLETKVNIKAEIRTTHTSIVDMIESKEREVIDVTPGKQPRTIKGSGNK